MVGRLPAASMEASQSVQPTTAAQGRAGGTDPPGDSLITG